MSEPRSLLMTGGSGLLGRWLHQLLPEYRFTLSEHRTRAAMLLRRGDRRRRADLCERDAARRLLELAEPEAVLHLAALSSLAGCEANPARAHRLNVDATAGLAQAAAAAGAYLIHFSTDQVFGGDDAPYREEARPDPVSEYGRTKALAEREVLRAHPHALVLRVALVLAPSRGGHSGALDMLRPGSGREPVTLFTDEWRTPLSVRCVARALAALLRERPAGICHLAGGERVTRLELGERIRRAFGWTTAITGVSREQARLRRPRDVSLATRRSQELGVPAPRPLEEALAELAEGDARSQ